MRPLRGIALKLISVLVFITMTSLFKTTAKAIPPGEIVFFRSFFAIPVIVVWLALRRELKTGFQAHNLFGHFWRGLMGTIAMVFSFAGLAYLPLPEVTAIGYASPLLVVVFAAMFLGEEVRLFRIASVALGLLGVMVVLSPRLSVVSGDVASQREAFGAILVLCGAFCAALSQVFVRKLVNTEKTASIVFYFSVSSALLSLVTLPYGWMMPTMTEAVALICGGLLGGLGQILLTSAYREADASLVAPFDYASILFALLIGYFAFDEVPTPTVLMGAGLVIFAGVLIIWRERKLGLERARGRKAMTP